MVLAVFPAEDLRLQARKADKNGGEATLVATPQGAGEEAGLSVGLGGGAGGAAAFSREELGGRPSAQPGRRASRAGGALQTS